MTTPNASPSQSDSEEYQAGLRVIEAFSDEAKAEALLAKLPPSQRKTLQGQLTQLRQRIQANPLEKYVPHPKQAQFHGATARTRMFVAGSRTGKSHCGTCDDLIQALPPDLVPERLHPFKKYGWEEPIKARVITPDLGHTMEVILDKFRELTPRAALLGESWDDAFDKTKRILRFKRGDVVDFMSFEQGVDKFGGVALHRVHFDEEPGGPNSWAIYRDCRTRIMDFSGDHIFTMTPLAQTDWVQDKLWDKRGTDRVFGIQASMYDNPHIPRKEIEDRLEDLTTEERDVILLGKFRHFGGLFYDEFGEEHVQAQPDRQTVAEWEVVVGIDPGQITGVVWVAFDNDNGAVVFDEFYPKGALIPEIADKIKAKNEDWGVDPTYVIDPAARIRSGPNQEQFTTEYARNGIYCAEGQNARGPGIMEVKRRLQQGKLFLSEDCRNLIWEFSRYRRDENSTDDWAAIKKNDHLLDALRYVCMSRTWTLPKLRSPRSNYNADPMFEPPWTGPTPTDSPPLGALS